MSSHGAEVPHPTSPSTTPQPDQINLRVTYLHAGNPRPPHVLGAVPAGWTVSQLKQRLQDALPEHPRPDEQRLIYQGRPLMQSSSTLREALRLDAGPIGPLPYTLHIIIQSRQPQNQPQNMPPQIPLAQPPQTQPDQRQDQADLPPLVHAPNDALAQAQHVQALAQAQLNMLQQHLAAWNTGSGQNNAQLPQSIHTTSTFHIHGQQLPSQQPLPPGFFPAPSNLPSLQAMLGEQQRLRAEVGLQGTHHHTVTANASDSNGHVPLPVVPGSSHQHAHLPAGTTRIREVIGPNGERITQVANSSSDLPTQFERSASAPAPVPPTAQHADQIHAQLSTPTINAANPQPSLFPNTLPPLSRHLPHPFAMRQQAPPNGYTNPLVWLTTSRNGPEALLFAPGHGYFHSNPQVAQHGAISQASGLPQPPLVQSATTPAPIVRAHPAQPPPANQPAAQLAVREPAAAAPPQQQQAVPGQNENDLFAFIVQRTWLFIRLYMFMFVLSEPGTWRRWFLLALAVLVCVLPRQNPLNDAFVALRRHVDNLIGPPQPQPRDRAQAPAPDQQQGNGAPQANNAAAPALRTRGAVRTTPEETAARLVREHQERNPSFIRNTLYRIEQAVALFLASLIPGVGERHVRAREEARDAQRRREEEARAAEQQTVIERQGQQQVQDGGADENTPGRERKSSTPIADITRTETGSSSGIEAREGSRVDQVRARGAATSD